MKPIRFLVVLVFFVLAAVVDVAKALTYLALFPFTLIPLILWAALRLAKVVATVFATAIWTAFEVGKLAVCSAFWWALPLAVTVLMPNTTALKAIGVNLGSGVGILLAGAVFTQTDIINVMFGILKAAGIRPLKTFAHQLPNDARTLGAIVEWISPSRESFLKIRQASNLAGLWFSHVEFLYETSSIGWVVSVFVVQDKNKMS